MALTIRNATLADHKDACGWLKDAKSRNSNPELKKMPPVAFKKWFAESLKNAGRRVFIALGDKNRKIGMVIFDIVDSESSEISVSIENSAKLNGLTPKIIKASCDKVFQKKDSKFISGKIKKDDHESQEEFEKAGFFKIVEFYDKKTGSVIVMGKQKAV